MKKILFLLILCSSIFAQSEEEMLSSKIFEPENKPNWNSNFERFEYTEVIEVDDLKKDEIYYRLVRWATLSYPSVKNVVELQDKESGNIIIKAVITNESYGETKIIVKKRPQKFDFTFPFVLDIKIKDGKYKYELFISKVKFGVTIGTTSAPSFGFNPIRNFHHNDYYENEFFKNKSMYDLVDEKVQELLLNMQIFVLGESLDENW